MNVVPDTLKPVTVAEVIAVANKAEPKLTQIMKELVKRLYIMAPFGKILVVIGFIIVGVGILFMYSDKIPFLGRLPGEHQYQKRKFSVVCSDYHKHHYQHCIEFDYLGDFVFQ